MRSKRLRPPPARNAALSISAPWPYRGETTMSPHDRNLSRRNPSPPPSPTLPSPASARGLGRGAGEGSEGADDAQRRIAFRFGLSAESRAAALLIAKGYRILARRFRT